MTNKNVVTGTGDNFGFEEVTSNSFAEHLAKYEKMNDILNIKTGSRVQGTVISKTGKYTSIDINGKSNVLVENTLLERSVLDNLSVGSQTEVLIKEITDRKEYIITGSVYELKMVEVQDFLETAMKNKTTLVGTPKEMNHAGYTVAVHINDQTISLFMPHLLTDVNKLPNPESIIDTEIEFLLESSYKDGNKSFIASRKAYLQQIGLKEIKDIKKGELYTGFVTGTTDYAVYVQFKTGLTAMIHKSNLSEQAIAMLEKGEITDGHPIEFYIKDIIKNKIFATQIAKESLWDSIAVDQVLTGTVSSVKDFGVLVDLDYETKGLLHKSVLVEHLTSYKKGQTVNVVVTAVNKNNRQITLVLK